MAYYFLQSPMPCVFPFKFLGEVYQECTNVRDPGGKLWCVLHVTLALFSCVSSCHYFLRCSTEVDADGEHVYREDTWGHCDMQSCGKMHQSKDTTKGTNVRML